jgi:alpha-tubulin suppressor-like RCC1 family protein
MNTLSMLLLIFGAGGVLLGLAWSAIDGATRINLKPAMVGIVLLGLGVGIPVGSLGDTNNPPPPPEQPPEQPPPGQHPGSPPGQHPGSPPGQHPPPGFGYNLGPQAQDLSLDLAPSIVTRARFACQTDSAGKGLCWGEPVPVPEAPIAKFVLGREHGCALLQTGALSCWGEAQLGASRLSAQRFIDVAASLETICGITAQGALHCFGADAGMPEPGLRLTGIWGGASHFCALTESGGAQCWGDNSEGQSSAPKDVVFASLSAGHFHSCGLDNSGEVHCWGRETEGQTRPPTHLRLNTISTGWDHSCGLDAQGQAHCWGCKARHNDLLIGDACSPPKASLTAISAGDLWRSCAITAQGETECWGGMTRIGGPS